MRVRDVMSRRVRTIGGRASVERARALMQTRGVHHLPVPDECRRVVGIISWSDLRAAPEGAMVQDYMPHKLLIVRPDTSLGGAAALMRAHTIGALPVMDGARLAGILTVSNLLALVDQHSDALAEPPIHRGRLAHATPVAVDDRPTARVHAVRNQPARHGRGKPAALISEDC